MPSPTVTSMRKSLCTPTATPTSAGVWGAAGAQAALLLVLWVGAAGALQAQEDAAAASAEEAEEAAAAAPATTHRMPRLPMDNRVRLLAKELKLDAHQQTEVTKVLQAQRAEVAKVWSDPLVSSALRIAATQAIGDKTAERIRALLNEEQRSQYIKPRQHEAPVGAPGGDVQKWIQNAQDLEPPQLAAAKGK